MASLLRSYKCVFRAHSCLTTFADHSLRSAFIQRRPMFGQCATSGVLFGASDIVAQHAVEKRGLAKHDVRRFRSRTGALGC